LMLCASSCRASGFPRYSAAILEKDGAIMGLPGAWQEVQPFRAATDAPSSVTAQVGAQDVAKATMGIRNRVFMASYPVE
jgi:hypothetical protein